MRMSGSIFKPVFRFFCASTRNSQGAASGRFFTKASRLGSSRWARSTASTSASRSGRWQSAGAEGKTALPLPVGAQVRADGSDVGKLRALRGHGFRQQGAGLRLQLQGRAGAPVAAVVPLQADNAAARTQVCRRLAALWLTEAGQQKRI